MAPDSNLLGMIIDDVRIEIHSGGSTIQVGFTVLLAVLLVPLLLPLMGIAWIFGKIAKWWFAEAK